jgi:hypothetical protein
LAFPICSTTQKFFLDGLNKLEQGSHKWVELKGEYVNTFFNPVACFLYKAKDLSAPLVQFETFNRLFITLCNLETMNDCGINVNRKVFRFREKNILFFVFENYMRSNLCSVRPCAKDPFTAGPSIAI